MRTPTIQIVSFFFGCLLAKASLAQPIVGIFGDVHGHQPGMTSALTKMKDMGVTHIVGTGDFIGWGNVEELDRLLAAMQVITQVPPQKTYLMPGNWEHEANIDPKSANAVLKKYGQLISERYDGYGIITIGGIKVMVSHFPQHPIPAQYIPPRNFLRRLPGQAFVLDTMNNNIYPPVGVEFEIFAHNHIRAAYVDPTSQRMVINAGVIDPKTRAPTEQRAFAIYNGSTKDVVFYGIEDGQILATVNTGDRTVTLATLEGLKGCEALRQSLSAP